MVENNITVFIAGDSTAADKSSTEKPMSGWGEFIADYFNETIQFSNQAINGRSTKSFLEQNRLEPILSKGKAGDYLLIQFGHNDQKIDDPERFTDPFGNYMDNLKYYIDKTTKNGMIPILMTSISRRQFKEGRLDPMSLGSYPEAMRKVATEKSVSIIDMHRITSAYIDKLGEASSKELFLHLEPNMYSNYPEGLTDNTHFSEEGAKMVASLIAEELTKTVPAFHKRQRMTERAGER
ncbi:rhamnogalacturonan acetylesterase [Marinilactibacillus sp. XAAS-LB27]|uniref:rhamnogalacturonan acetylesterase n=1 Tax=Marinilactibacillus sp. XAAS-LB27 TaxID=3114538 RepID=UPI002E17F791|nr:rhamnogalacturonan acetylesterase [Marinilactibacillus sp. XAAS-LB27]